MRDTSSTESSRYGHRQTECLKAAAGWPARRGAPCAIPSGRRAAAAAPAPAARNFRRFIICASQVLPLQLAHGVIHRARRQGHIGDRRILAGGARHARPISDVDVRRIVKLVVGVEGGGLRIASHPRCPHLVNTETGLGPQLAGLVHIPSVDVAHARRLEHLPRLFLHVAAHRDLVRRPFTADAEQRNAPLVGLLRIEPGTVLLHGKRLAKREHADTPWSGLVQLLLELDADARLADASSPTAAAGAPLIPVAARELQPIGPCALEVAESRNVEAVRAIALVVAIEKAGNLASSAGHEVVVHQIVTDHPTRIAESVGEARSFGVQKYACGPERGRAEEDHARVNLVCLPCGRVDEPHARRPVATFIIKNAVRETVRPQRELSGLASGGQRRRLAREIRAGRASAIAGAAVVTRLPLTDGLRQHRAATDGDVPSRKCTLDAGLHELLPGVELHRLLELTVRQVRQPELLTGNPGKPLDVAVPRLDVAVPNRPIDAVAVLEVRLEIEVAPPVRLTSPDQ